MVYIQGLVHMLLINGIHHCSGKKSLNTFCSNSKGKDLLILQFSKNLAKNQDASLPILQVVLLERSPFGFSILLKQGLKRTVLPQSQGSL